MSLDAGKDRSVPDVSSSTFANLRRAKSLDRRVTESSMTVSTATSTRVQAVHYIYSTFQGPIKCFFMIQGYAKQKRRGKKLNSAFMFEPSPVKLIRVQSREDCWGDPVSVWLVSLLKLQLLDTPPPPPNLLHHHSNTHSHTFMYTRLPPPPLKIINSRQRSSHSRAYVPGRD